MGSENPAIGVGAVGQQGGPGGSLETVEALPYMRALREFLELFSKQGPRLVGSEVDPVRKEALDVAVAYVGVAVDHLVTYEVIVREAVPTFAGYSVLRPALEGAERAQWLLPQDPDDGLARLLADRWATLDEQRKDLNAIRDVFGASDTPSEALDARMDQLNDYFAQVLRRAADNDVVVRERRDRGADGQRRQPQEHRGPDVVSIPRNRVLDIGERYPTATTLMQQVLAADPNHGPLIYRQMSSSVHARWEGTNPVATETVDRGSPGDGVAASLTADLDHLELAYELTAGSVILAAGTVADLSGYCPHQFQIAQRNMMRQRKGKARLWPPPDRILAASFLEFRSPCPCCASPQHRFDNERGWIVWCRTCPPAGESALELYEHVTGHRPLV